jgi:hypothetical protein
VNPSELVITKDRLVRFLSPNCDQSTVAALWVLWAQRKAIEHANKAFEGHSLLRVRMIVQLVVGNLD